MPLYIEQSVVSINSYAVPLFGLDEFPDWAQAAHPNASLCFQ